jgi:tRNA pseudouridine55 synthase
MIDGILLVDKNEGISSYDVIRKLKKLLPKGQKIGHAGTLDPFATGLLVILLGKGTKLMSKFLTLEKEYTVKAEFGYETDTQDKEGKVVEKKETKKISKRDIKKVIKNNFIGEIDQVPPIFSAKKIKGKKAYDLAREGKEVDLPSKRIDVKKFKISEYKWPFVEFKIQCSSGTYVRTLVRDLGRELDTFATAVELRRDRIGAFDVKYSIPVEDFSVYISQAVVPVDKLDIFFTDER